MNTRDYMTSVYIDLETIQDKLENIQNAEDFEEAEFIASELACDIKTIISEIDENFELNMYEV